MPNGHRVRLESETLRWVDMDAEGNLIEKLLGENIIYTATTTEHYWEHEGVKRRLLIDHTLEFYEEHGIWQIDKLCYVVG